MRASEIAEIVGGVLEGEGDPELTGVAPLDRAGPQDLSLLAHGRYAAHLERSGAGAVLVSERLASRAAGIAAPRIVVRDVHRALALVLPRLFPEARPEPGVHPTAVVGAGTVLGAEVSIGPYAVIGRGVRVGDRVRIGAHVVVGDGCELGDDVVLHPHVTLYPGVRVGARSIVHSGARLGVDGFGYVRMGGSHRKIPQVGQCVIGADVEIGANTTIDRGSIGATEVGNGTKIDNLVHLGHNVRVGENVIIVAQVGVSGSAVLGREVTVAGQVGIPGHVVVGDGATLAARAGPLSDVPPGAVYSGFPAGPHRETLRAQAAFVRLPEIVKRIRALERALFGQDTSEE